MRPVPRPHSLRQLLQAAWPVLLALLVTVVVFRDVGRYGFVNFDDDVYVYENPRVTDGLSPGAIGWALSTGQAGVWIPATWLSFQLDASLSGAGPAGFHRTNLLLHLLNVLLVFLVVRGLTGTPVGAGLAAALFGVHPVNVEAVAWVTARKDLLMTSFLLGAVLAGLSVDRRGRRIAAGALAVLAMAAKPAAVMTPLLLLLVARWRFWRPEGPRRRWSADLAWTGGLLVFAAGVAFATYRLAHGVELSERFRRPLLVRAGEAAVGVFRYLRRLAWPEDLAVRYSDAVLRTSVGPALLAGVVLVVLTVAAVRWRRRAALPALGWGWFLVCLLPSLGIVQGGQLPLADRYVYCAGVGLWAALVGLACRATGSRRSLRAVALVVGLALVFAAAAGARRQVAVWRDSEQFWRHELAVNANSELAHRNLGVLLDARGRPDEALPHLDAALAIRPRAETHYNAGNVCAKRGRAAEAEQHFRSALRLDPALTGAALNLGALLVRQSRLPEARDVLLAAEARQPDLAPVQYNLAVIAWLQGDLAGAQARCRRALELDPAHAGARDLLAKIAAGAAPGGGS
jgi:tetratricopeptide (TPR) repeat protein